MKLKDNFVQAAKELMGTTEEQEKKELGTMEQRNKDKLDERVAALQTLLNGKSVTAGATVLGEGAVFTGNLEASGPVELRGIFTGNIVSKEEIKLSGTLTGDVTGANIQINGCRLKGNVNAEKDVRIDAGSVIIGNISADSVALNGKVRGDLNIRRALVLEAHATLLGNAGAATISIQEGAVFQGEMKSTSTDLVAMFGGEEEQ